MQGSIQAPHLTDVKSYCNAMQCNAGLEDDKELGYSPFFVCVLPSSLIILGT